MLGSSWVAAQLAASQEGPSSMSEWVSEWVSESTLHNFDWWNDRWIGKDLEVSDRGQCLSRHMPGGTEEMHGKPQPSYPGRNPNRTTLEYTSRTLPLHQRGQFGGDDVSVVWRSSCGGCILMIGVIVVWFGDNFLLIWCSWLCSDNSILIMMWCCGYTGGVMMSCSYGDFVKILLYVHPLLDNMLVNSMLLGHATIEEAVFSVSAVTSQQWIVITWHVFSVDATYAPIGWLDSDGVICVYYRFMSVPQLHK
jgi:hypothetical protein